MKTSQKLSRTQFPMPVHTYDSQIHRMTRVYGQRRALMEKGLQDLDLGTVARCGSGGSSF